MAASRTEHARANEKEDTSGRDEEDVQGEAGARGVYEQSYQQEGISGAARIARRVCGGNGVTHRQRLLQ